MKKLMMIFSLVFVMGTQAQAKINAVCTGKDSKGAAIVVSVMSILNQDGSQATGYAGPLYSIDVKYNAKSIYTSSRALYSEENKAFTTASGFSLSQLDNTDAKNWNLYLDVRDMWGGHSSPVFNTIRLVCNEILN